MNEIKQYALIKNNTVENVIIADLEFVQTIQNEWDNVIEIVDTAVSIGWSYVNDSFVEPEQEIVIQPTQNRHITIGAFKNRLTSDERKAIRALAKVNEDVEDYMDILNSSTYVDLDDLRTRGGLQFMESAGILDTGRALDILDTDIQPNERP